MPKVARKLIGSDALMAPTGRSMTTNVEDKIWKTGNIYKKKNMRPRCQHFHRLGCQLIRSLPAVLDGHNETAEQERLRERTSPHRRVVRIGVARPKILSWRDYRCAQRKDFSKKKERWYSETYFHEVRIRKFCRSSQLLHILNKKKLPAQQWALRVRCRQGRQITSVATQRDCFRQSKLNIHIDFSEDVQRCLGRYWNPWGSFKQDVFPFREETSIVKPARPSLVEEAEILCI